MAKKKFFIITTIPISLFFFRNQITFLKDEFEIHVVSSKGDLLNEISKLEQVPYHQVNMRRDISLFRDIISLFKLCYLFIKERPYIVHGNTPKAGLLSMLAAFITFVPKRIYYIHGLRYEGIFGFKKKLIIFMEKAACFFSTHIIAVSFGVKEKLIKEVTNKNVIVIGNGSVNGINTEFFCSEKVDSSNLKLQLEIKEADFVFGFIGRLVKDKGINELVQCFSTLSSEYKHCKLLLVGNYEGYLSIAKKNGIKVVRTNPDVWFWNRNTKLSSVARAFDTLMPISSTLTFDEKKLVTKKEVLLLPASRFLRPYNNNEKYIQSIKLKRILNEMTYAAKNNKVYHLWWHPHNFGYSLYENLNNLENILKHFEILKSQFAFESKSMIEMY